MQNFHYTCTAEHYEPVGCASKARGAMYVPRILYLWWWCCCILHAAAVRTYVRTGSRRLPLHNYCCYYQRCNLSPTQIPSTLSSKRGYGSSSSTDIQAGRTERYLDRILLTTIILLCTLYTHDITPKIIRKGQDRIRRGGRRERHGSWFVVTLTNTSSAAVQCSPTKGDLSTCILVNKCQTV